MVILSPYIGGDYISGLPALPVQRPLAELEAEKKAKKKEKEKEKDLKYTEIPYPGGQRSFVIVVPAEECHTSDAVVASALLPEVQDIPEHKNSAVWITNLPYNITLPSLLAAVRNCGRVWTAQLQQPLESCCFTTAVITFFTRRGAIRLMKNAHRGEFIIDGYLPIVVTSKYNRIHLQDSKILGGGCSRSIKINGPPIIVNEDFLSAFFTEYFDYEIDSVVTKSQSSLAVTQIWTFCSYRGQADEAFYALEEQKKIVPTFSDNLSQLWPWVQVEYERDPCDRVRVVEEQAEDVIDEYVKLPIEDVKGKGKAKANAVMSDFQNKQLSLIAESAPDQLSSTTSANTKEDASVTDVKAKEKRMMEASSWRSGSEKPQRGRKVGEKSGKPEMSWRMCKYEAEKSKKSENDGNTEIPWRMRKSETEKKVNRKW